MPHAPGAPRHVVVIGAGAFGGWTALELVRRGVRVTLVDAWGPGHTRASSGGETRIIRATYGSHTIYTAMARRAFALWRAYDERWHTEFLRKTGALWMFGQDASVGRASANALRAEGLPCEWLTPTECRRRYPQINLTGVSSVLFEPDAGYLLARRACDHVAARVVAEGGEYRQVAASSPVPVTGKRLSKLRLGDGDAIEADAFVFACGPWLGALFPDVMGRLITPTRQEVYYFGTPAGDDRFTDARLPVWLDVGKRLMYGIPGDAHRGFKIADDTSGRRFNPTTGSRDLTATGVRAARAFLRRRFPALASAPFLGGEVCQYEASPDSSFIIDAHPRASNVWMVGGGSGHGFKMGPVIGEMVAALVLDQARPDPIFSLARFAAATKKMRWKPKWS